MAAVDRFGSLADDQASSHTVVEMEGLLRSNDHGLDSFFAEVETTKEKIKQVRASISDIESLHHATLLSSSDRDDRVRLDELCETVKSDIARLRSTIKGMMQQTDRMRQTRTAQIRRTHERGLAKDTMNVAVEYQNTIQKVKVESQEKLDRQHKILVQSGATEGDIQAAIFGQQFVGTHLDRQQESLNDVRTRHREIQQIETAITELFELMQEMSFLLDQHQEIINVVEEQVEQTDENVVKGNRELHQATVHAKSSRKMKWILTGICFVILIIIAIVIAVEVKAQSSK
ncbi:Syntaxin-2 [Thoreauomyces humboldtii]|nr:Syntaxin-2 [Thoreauomyces humboldtii]